MASISARDVQRGWFATCSEMVLLPDFERSAKLPEGEEVPIDLLPEEPAEYELACQMGMLRGKLVVK